MKSNPDVNGILVVDKPAGITSHDVVDRVRRLFRTKRVGHTGTLDPDATGVLVLCLGQATRLAEYLASAAKHYEAEFVFGIRTDTMDASGTILDERDASGLTAQSTRELLHNFRGRILQTPPMVSARHHDGRRLYELAREGVTVDREAREVEISELELKEFNPGAHPHATLEVTCSTGTYIRVLAEDMGAAAGTGAMMKSLRRTWVGADAAVAFTLAEAHTLETLERASASAGHAVGQVSGPPARTLSELLVPLAAALRWMPQFQVQEDALRRLRQGQSIAAAHIAVGQGSVGAGASNASANAGGLAAILDERGEVCAVVRAEAEMLRPVKVLALR